jgi:hypothetical protein
VSSKRARRRNTSSPRLRWEGDHAKHGGGVLLVCP